MNNLIRATELATIFEKTGAKISIWGFFSNDNDSYYRYIPQRDDFEAFDEEPKDIQSLSKEALKRFLNATKPKKIECVEEASNNGWYYMF